MKGNERNSKGHEISLEGNGRILNRWEGNERISKGNERTLKDSEGK